MSGAYRGGLLPIVWNFKNAWEIQSALGSLSGDQMKQEYSSFDVLLLSTLSKGRPNFGHTGFRL